MFEALEILPRTQAAPADRPAATEGDEAWRQGTIGESCQPSSKLRHLRRREVLATEAPEHAPARARVATLLEQRGEGVETLRGQRFDEERGGHLAIVASQAPNGGRINGQQIELITHDSKYDMTVTAQVAKQYVEQDKVPVFLGYTDSDSVIASGRVFQDAKIPFITVGATSPKLPSQIGDMLFLACFG